MIFYAESKGLDLPIIRCDDGGELVKLLSLAANDIDQPAAGTHIGEISNAILQVKKVVRGVISVLSYVVGYLLTIAAVMSSQTNSL